MDNGEGELAQVKVEADAMFQETMENDIKPDIVKEEPRETVFFIKCEMCNENAPNEAVCAHIKNDRLGDLEHENKLPLSRVYTDTFNQDVESKMDNPEPSSSQKEDSIMKLINAEITVKEEEYYDSPEYLSTDMDLIECEIGQVKTEPIDDRSSLSSDMLAQDEDSNEDVQPGSSKESQKGFKMKLQTDYKFTTDEVTKKPSSSSSTENETSVQETNPNKEKPHGCTICLKTFSKNSSLIKHKRIHTGEKPFQCNLCSKWFASKSRVVSHQEIHTGERPFQCKACSKRFTRSSLLITHLKRIHAEERPFRCETCLMRFFSNGQLEAHRKLHNTLRCPVCSKCFSRKTQLALHERTHTGEKPNTCKVCFKSCADHSSFIIHSRSHTGEKPFQCRYCSKSFSCRGTLVKHERIHTGDTPYDCKVCLKSFMRRSYLTTHERDHHGKRPF